MHIRQTILTMMFVLVSSCLVHGQRFEPKLLTVDSNEGVAIADVNNDGKLDVIAGRQWYAAPDFVPRPLRIIADWNGYVESNGDFTADVNGDGWIDVVAGSFIPGKVFWFENPGKEGLELGQLWTVHEWFDTGQSQNEFCFLRDMDGDQTPDWIVNSWNVNNPMVVWRLTLPINDDAAQPTKHVVGNKGNGHGMGFGDINNDGLEDIVFARGWYERPAEAALEKTWDFHDDWELPQASCPILVKDLNGDGKNDLIWGRGHDYGLYWWEGRGPDADGKLLFEKHVIDESFSQAHAIHFADLDGDGADELITGKRLRAHNGNDPGGTEPPCMYFYHWNSDSSSFDRHVIEEGHVGTGLQIRTADLNGDKRIDIAVAGKDGTWILFNRKNE